METGSDPIFYVLVVPKGAKAALPVDATDLITGFEFEDSEKKADKLTLTIDNWDLSNFDRPIWIPDNLLYVTWGYRGRVCPERTCIIQKVTGSTELKVEALGKSIVMNRESRNATYAALTRSQVVRQIANRYGYADAACFIEETTEVYEHIAQARATDAQFIKRLADAESFEFYIDFEGFHWHPRRVGQRPHRVLQWLLPPDVGDVISFNVENDIFAKPKKVSAKGRDPLGKKYINGHGSDADTARDILREPVGAGIAEQLAAMLGPGEDRKVENPPGQTTPAGGLAQTAYRLVVDITNGSKMVDYAETQPTTETSDGQAKKEAGGKFKRAAQTTVKLEMSLVGDPFIFAKTVLDVRGISKRLSGLYYVNEVKHSIGSGGYTVSLKCSTDGTNGGAANGNVLALETADKKKKAAKAAASKGKPNTQEAATDAGALAYRKNFNPATGEFEIDYFSLGGKPSAATAKDETSAAESPAKK